STLGNASAQQRVRAAIKGAPSEVQLTAGAYGSLGSAYSVANKDATALAKALGITKGELRAQQAETRSTALATANLGQVYRGVPKDVITKIRALGGEVTRRQLADLARSANLTPKEIRIIMRANNIKGTVKDIRGVGDTIREVDETRANLKAYSDSTQRGVNLADRNARRGVTDLTRTLEGVQRSRALRSARLTPRCVLSL
ncbi:hypothetical protein, partial [Streptomyces rhizosphaericus]|uniref:hypothetical protein n=1 Tax=Streptomyces rhizosphaericus TaxID=114699 RepID=UPI0031DC6774